MSRKLLKESLNFFLKTIKMKIIDINESGTSINKNLFKELNMSNNCIFDVGANTGYVARAYSSEFEKCEIHCFEPNMQVFEKLKKIWKMIDLYLTIKESQAKMEN